MRCGALRSSFAVLAVLIGLILPVSAQRVLEFVPTAFAPTALAVNPITNMTYVGGYGGNGSQVDAIDGYSNSFATISLENPPSAIAVNPRTNRIYVASQASSSGIVTAIDGTTFMAITTVQSGGRGASAIAINTITNQIYVANGFGDNTVTVIDGASNKPTSLTVGGNATAVAVNEATNQIYVSDASTNLVTVIDGATNLTTNIPVGGTPQDLVVNPATNKVYVTSQSTFNVTVIDGATRTATSIPIGATSYRIALNPVTNKIYVVSFGKGEVTVIDGATNTAAPPITGIATPEAIAVDILANKIYVPSQTGYTTDPSVNLLYVIDGATNNVSSVSVGNQPALVAVNQGTQQIYVGNANDQNVAVLGGVSPLRFVPITPCRLADTRKPTPNPIPAKGSRDFLVAQYQCGIPPTAEAYSFNVTVIPDQPLGFLSIYPQPYPAGTGTGTSTSLMNSFDGRVKASAAIVPAGLGSSVEVFVSGQSNVVLDVNGYFIPEYYVLGKPFNLEFYPVPPCRVADTRQSGGPLAALETRPFAMTGTCGLPPEAQAYSLNFTVVPSGPLGFISAWPEDNPAIPQPSVSILNSYNGQVVANAALVPAGNTNNGGINVFASNPTQVIIDTNGYFAPPLPGPPSPNGGTSLYTVNPCRVIDTRKGAGAFSGFLSPAVDVAGGACGPLPTSGAYVLTATVLPTAGTLGFMALAPDPQTSAPSISTTNSYDGSVVSNMAIVPTYNGSTDAFASSPIQLILDISSYFDGTVWQPPIITTTSLPDAEVNVPYSATLNAVQGVQPYEWSVFSGTLPPGLYLSPVTGVIYGMSSTTGTYTFTVQATDVLRRSGYASLSLTVSNTNFSIVTRGLPVGNQNSPYPTTRLTTTGGTPPFSWTISAGTLPPGLIIDNLTGTISGIPTTVGTFKFQVSVDTVSNHASEIFSIFINSGDGNGLLSGQYAVSVAGVGGDGGVDYVIGSFVADGAGNITKGEFDSNFSTGTPQTGFNITSGSYSFDKSGQGAISITIGDQTIVLGAVISSTSGNGQVMQFTQADGSGGSSAGVILKQDTSTFSLGSLQGNFAFGKSGVDQNTNGLDVVGSFQLDSSGNLSNGQRAADDGGLMSSATFYGSLQAPDTYGRGTMSEFINSTTTRNSVYYMVSANEYLSLTVDALGAGAPILGGSAKRQNGLPFIQASLNGNAIVEVQGVRPPPDPGDPLYPNVRIQLLQTDGVTNATLVVDGNMAGSITHNTYNGTYTVASNGLVMFDGLNFIYYLVGPNEGYVLGIRGDIGSGYFWPQSAGPFGDSSIPTFSIGGSLPLPLSGSQDEIDLLNNQGLGAFIAYSTDATGNTQTLPGTYTIDSTTGRFPITINGSPAAVGYVISPAQSVVMTFDQYGKIITFQQR